MSVAETAVDVGSWIVWTLVVAGVLIAFFNGEVNHSEGTVKGNIKEIVNERDYLLNLMETPCKGMMPAEYINLFLKGNPDNIWRSDFKKENIINKFEKKEYAVYLERFDECIDVSYSISKDEEMIVSNFPRASGIHSVYREPELEIPLTTEQGDYILRLKNEQ